MDLGNVLRRLLARITHETVQCRQRLLLNVHLAVSQTGFDLNRLGVPIQQTISTRSPVNGSIV